MKLSRYDFGLILVSTVVGFWYGLAGNILGTYMTDWVKGKFHSALILLSVAFTSIIMTSILIYGLKFV